MLASGRIAWRPPSYQLGTVAMSSTSSVNHGKSWRRWVALYGSSASWRSCGSGRCHHSCLQFTCEHPGLREINRHTAGKRESGDSNSMISLPDSEPLDLSDNNFLSLIKGAMQIWVPNLQKQPAHSNPRSAGHVTCIKWNC